MSTVVVREHLGKEKKCLVQYKEKNKNLKTGINLGDQFREGRKSFFPKKTENDICREHENIPKVYPTSNQ